MTKENSAGLGVFNNYGPRSTDEGRYSEKTREDSELEVEIAFHGNDYTTVTGVIPAGANLRAATINVVQAFAMTGTAPTILLGTSTSEVTNGLVISKTIAEAVGRTDIFSTAAGTWAALLAADTTANIVLGGTSPTIGTGGHAVIKLHFDIA